ncbi:hypothetical protein [Paraliomyxa miuraensis]|uniref:hypothetical protein n=1 Tax=Paraliomyxa miuraensis TaxID=376150 RepID=UPI00224EB5F9|nr:hypothetical protein [Paraliomyxa miuraensis]MCX4246367.1 hypothetical protein [Paraliomyxa miuraensis]
MVRLVFVLSVVLAGGCTRPPPPVEAPPAAAEPAPEPEDELPPPEAEPPPPAPAPCAGGRLWDGKPVDCSYEHGGCCYDSPANACKAAGCAEGRCAVLESYPAQVRCEA